MATAESNKTSNGSRTGGQRRNRAEHQVLRYHEVYQYHFGGSERRDDRDRKEQVQGYVRFAARPQLLGAHEACMLKSPGADTYPRYQTCRFLTQSSHDPIPRPASGGFDTILQSMGLCSTANPSALLSHLGRLSNPTGGRILLLEHGRSHYEWLNRILDEHAPAHADKHGCWWNRDIQKIVQDSGLEIVQIKRYHFGTTWWIELKAGPGRGNACE